MKKIYQGIVATGICFGMLGVVNGTASANSQYSAKRANSVRLVWRTNMKRHAYTATQGARYSKHLGIRYSNNDVTPTVTWYTDAHEKLYKKYQGHSTTYYHVRSADGTLQGWIWRGYLKRITSTTKPTIGSVENNGTKTDYDSIARNAVRSLGGNAQLDTDSTQLAKEILQQALNSEVHFTTQAEAYPNNPEKANDKDVSISNLTADNVETVSDKYLLNLMKTHGIDGAGYGANKADNAFVIGNNLDVANILAAYFGPSSDYYGQQGLTEKNFFSQVKIGVAVSKTNDGRTAMFAIFRYPNKYAKLVAE